MLFGIPADLPPQLLQVLASMGHADELVVCDANFPAHANARHTHHGHAIELPGRNSPQAIADILSLMPLDAFEAAPVVTMSVPGEHASRPEVQQEVEAILARTPGAPWPVHDIDRFDFYTRARSAFCVVRTLERRPWGCFILKKGVLTPAGELMTPEYANQVD